MITIRSLNRFFTITIIKPAVGPRDIPPNIAGISDVLFDHLQSVEQDQEKYLSNQVFMMKSL